VEYSKQFGIDAVCGSGKVASINEFEKIVLPGNREAFSDLLKEKGLWDKYSMLCNAKLNSQIIKGELVDGDICDMVGRVKDFRISLGRKKQVYA